MKANLEKRFPLLQSWMNGDDEDLHRKLRQEQAALLSSKAYILPKGSVYLNSTLHDSSLRRIERHDSDLWVVVEEFSTRCFCDALRTVLQLTPPEEAPGFLLTLKFTNVGACSIEALDHGAGNYFQPITAWPEFDDLPAPGSWTWLYDEITRIETSRICLGIIFWVNARPSKYKRLLFQVESEAMTFLENQEGDFLRAFEGKYGDLFTAFWRERQARKTFDYASALQFIDRVLSKT